MTKQETKTFTIAGRELARPPALRAGACFSDPETHRFAGTDRSQTPVTELVIHETVTRSAADTIRVLDRRDLGVHFIVDEHGAVNQHGDPAFDHLSHAGRRHNAVSAGVEVVNPYYPRYLKSGLPWTRVIDARWAHQHLYVLPTPAQAETTAQLIAWMTSPEALGLSIPRQWVGLRGATLKMNRVVEARKPGQGILAHTYFGHADGAWLVLYAWLRLEAGLAPCAAYEEAIERATGVWQVDLSDVLS